MKTSYYSKFKTTPGGICISTYPPRWIQGKIPEYRILAPKFDFRIPYDEYLIKFNAQLEKLNPFQVWADLHELANGHEPVLLCYEAPPFNKQNFCHRHMVADWLEMHLRKSIPEFSEPESGSLFG